MDQTMRRLWLGLAIFAAALAAPTNVFGGVVHATFYNLHSLFYPTGVSNGGAFGVGFDYHGSGELWSPSKNGYSYTRPSLGTYLGISGDVTYLGISGDGKT